VSHLTNNFVWEPYGWFEGWMFHFDKSYTLNFAIQIILVRMLFLGLEQRNDDDAEKHRDCFKFIQVFSRLIGMRFVWCTFLRLLHLTRDSKMFLHALWTFHLPRNERFHFLFCFSEITNFLGAIFVYSNCSHTPKHF
jgi:hypothetical protein